jgi:hypothetical protein
MSPVVGGEIAMLRKVNYRNVPDLQGHLAQFAG